MTINALLVVWSSAVSFPKFNCLFQDLIKVLIRAFHSRVGTNTKVGEL